MVMALARQFLSPPGPATPRPQGTRLALTAYGSGPTLGTRPCPDPMPGLPPAPRRAAALLLAAALAALAPDARAQIGAVAATEPVAEAEALFRDGRADEALARLDAYLDAPAGTPAAEDAAQAHYLRARILSAEPAPDPRRAARALDRAVALDPDNVLYLVAQLESQRVVRSNFLLDLVRAQRRTAIARRILALDPANAHAHEELGVRAIRDYYQYRNAVALPGLSFAAPTSGRGTDRLAETRDPRPGSDPGPRQDPVYASDPGADAFDDAEAVYADDRFDLDVLRAQSAGVVSFETRARRAYDDATGHLRAALSADPRRRSVYDHVARLAVLSGRWAEAAPDLREMDAQFPADAATHLYAGLAAQRTARYDDAEAAFDDALVRMAPAERAAFTDLARILPPADVAAYRADSAAFTERYWRSRDPRFLNDANERRSEHVARLAEADLLFRADALGRDGWDTERGRLHVRYGPPQSDVMIDGSFAQVVETYAGAAAVLGPSAGVDGSGPSAAEQSANRFNVWTYADGLRLVFEDPNRNNQFRLYSPPAVAYALRSGRGADRMDFAARAAEAVRDAPERYTFAPPGRQVELPYRVTAFRGAGARTALYVTFGVPLAEPAPASADDAPVGDAPAGDAPAGDVALTLRTGAFLVGADRRVLAERRRTVYGLRAAQIVAFDGARLWTATEPLDAPPGPSEVSLEFETAGGSTSAVQRRALVVPDFRTPGLHLSDVMLAYDIAPASAAADAAASAAASASGGEAAPGRVVRGGVAVLPAPWGVFAAGRPVFVYVEAYGLALAGGRTDAEVRASLVRTDVSTGLRRIARRLLGRRAPGVSTAFETQGASPDEPFDVQLDTAGQPPGRYTLTVTVRDRVSGATAARETDLLLDGPAALPAP